MRSKKKIRIIQKKTKMPIDYKNGKIYKIYCNASGNIYYGSTTQPLSKRMGEHRKDYAKYLTGSRKQTVTSFTILEGGDYDYSLVEEYPCDNKQQLHARERYYIENNVCVNKVVPGRTNQEYRAYYKEELKERSAKYHAEHKEEIKEKNAKYRASHKEDIKTKRAEKVTCVCGCVVTRDCFSRHKQSQTHQKLIQEKEEIKPKRSEKVTCDCGCVVTRSCLSRHKKSKKHLKLMQEKESE